MLVSDKKGNIIEIRFIKRECYLNTLDIKVKEIGTSYYTNR